MYHIAVVEDDKEKRLIHLSVAGAEELFKDPC